MKDEITIDGIRYVRKGEKQEEFDPKKVRVDVLGKSAVITYEWFGGNCLLSISEEGVYFYTYVEPSIPIARDPTDPRCRLRVSCISCIMKNADSPVAW